MAAAVAQHQQRVPEPTAPPSWTGTSQQAGVSPETAAEGFDATELIEMLRVLEVRYF